MSLFRQKREITGPPVTADRLIPRRTTTVGGVGAATPEQELRHSAVWACLRLRADLVSTMPVDAYRMVNDQQIEIVKRPVLIKPDGETPVHEWLFSTQFDLDRFGNVFGIITERTGDGLPARIELVPTASVTLLFRKGKLVYRIGNKEYSPDQVWHEKQYTVPGLKFGLSPAVYAAWTAGEYLTVQNFAMDWFGNGAVPKAALKNTKRRIENKDATEVKEAFKAAIAVDGLFVHGFDWEYSPIQQDIAARSWLDMKQITSQEIARFFNCPADLIDAMSGPAGGRVTYQNIIQRNIQFLIMNLGPSLTRREKALSTLLPEPRFVKLNTSSLLRMDDEARARFLQLMVAARIMTPTEARAKENLPPLTQDQIDEFTTLFPAGSKVQPSSPPVPALIGP